MSHPGNTGAASSVSAHIATPATATINTVCAAVSRAVLASFAPRAREITASAPTPTAKNMPLTNHVTEPVSPTAAEACAPSTPTMAVSTYCTSVCMAFSSITGQASAISAPISGQYSRHFARKRAINPNPTL